MFTTLVPIGQNLLTVDVADGIWTRFKGLMGRKELREGHGLLLLPCSSIHMMFMRFPIDAVFFDRDWIVLQIEEHLQPWTGLASCRGAYACLEIPAGSAFFYGLFEGKRVPILSQSPPR